MNEDITNMDKTIGQKEGHWWLLPSPPTPLTSSQDQRRGKSEEKERESELKWTNPTTKTAVEEVERNLLSVDSMTSSHRKERRGEWWWQRFIRLSFPSRQVLNTEGSDSDAGFLPSPLFLRCQGKSGWLLSWNCCECVSCSTRDATTSGEDASSWGSISAPTETRGRLTDLKPWIRRERDGEVYEQRMSLVLLSFCRFSGEGIVPASRSASHSISHSVSHSASHSDSSTGTRFTINSGSAADSREKNTWRKQKR